MCTTSERYHIFKLFEVKTARDIFLICATDIILRNRKKFLRKIPRYISDFIRFASSRIVPCLNSIRNLIRSTERRYATLISVSAESKWQSLKRRLV